MLTLEEIDAIYAKWEHQVREAGLQEGERQLLLKLLTRRFGPLPGEVIVRIQHASDEERERWAERLLSAPSLEAVLAP